MATLNRRPLAVRPLPLQVPSPHKAPSTVSGSSKRARSPDPSGDTLIYHTNPKRARAVVPPSTATRDLKAERKQAEREQQKAEFRDKFTRAFPSWTFYFDLDHIEPDRALVQSFETRIQHLRGNIEDFFSNEVTHLISNQPLPPPSTGDPAANKENLPRSKLVASRNGASLKSPIRLRGRINDDSTAFDLVAKAQSFGIKVWNTAKLESVLGRCLDQPTPSTSTGSRVVSASGHPPVIAGQQRSLSRLLQSERIHGTSERDPTQKRHDFRYFTRSSRFVLVEDMRQELATIAAHEYVVPKGRDENTKVPWPVLHCHPQARGPFIAYDEREKKRWEKLQQADMEQQDERLEQRNRVARAEAAMKRKAEAQLHSKREGDLRRSVSMSHLHRRASHAIGLHEHMIDLDGDKVDGEYPDSANASGYLASGAGTGYMAASGNSVGITSTTGTTSNAGYSWTNTKLPSALSGRIKQQVVTSRKFPSNVAEPKASVMGPPVGIPERQPVLRKSRSTNTLKLPKREEGSKPGYCESCRIKFEDFKAHIAGRKHTKFAADDANFLQLDCVLARVQRRTLEEGKDEQGKRELRHRQHCIKNRNDLHDLLEGHNSDGVLDFASPPFHPPEEPFWEDAEMDDELAILA